MPNNPTYFNAAFGAFLNGTTSKRDLTSPIPADYAHLVGAATAFATEVDSKIPTDALPTSSKANLVGSCCEGVIEGRSFDVPAAQLAAFYNELANVVAALYTEALPALA
jgi:hypothetical protein